MIENGIWILNADGVKLVLESTVYLLTAFLIVFVIVYGSLIFFSGIQKIVERAKSNKLANMTRNQGA